MTGLSGPDRVVVPLRIEVLPEAPADNQRAPVPRLVVDARLEGSGPWTAWFGASESRTLVLTVRNTGTAPADMRLAVAVGRGMATFEVSTSIHPWGLYATAFVAIGVIAVAGRNRLWGHGRSSTTGGAAVSPGRHRSISSPSGARRPSAWGNGA